MNRADALAAAERTVAVLEELEEHAAVVEARDVAKFLRVDSTLDGFDCAGCAGSGGANDAAGYHVVCTVCDGTGRKPKDGSVTVRIDRAYVAQMRAGLEGPFARIHLDETPGREPSLRLTVAPVAPAARRCRVGESMASDYFEHAAECPECSATRLGR